MLEIRIHGRGGQGAVVASKILAGALFLEGRFVQSFPMFGVERRGAPVTAFLRVDDTPIMLRCNIYEPDHIIVLDPTLMQSVDITKGLKKEGWIVINTSKNAEEFKFPGFRIAVVDANRIAAGLGVGSKTSPIVNTAILGAFAKVTGLIKLDSIVAALPEEVTVKQKENIEAVRQAYKEAKIPA